MARKNLLESVLGDDGKRQPSKPSRSNYGLKGASSQMKASLDTLAENAKKIIEGETIVEVNPDLIDISFIKDRLSGDDEEFQKLKRSVEDSTQQTPVLLRPHPDDANRYMIVFGHRRVRVARELNRPVRAVIKKLSNLEHVISQGQENTARSDLSFIEKALFAKRLMDDGYDRDIVKSALTVDTTLLSRMLSISQKVDETVIEAIGPAKSVGRDRWEAFKKLAILPANKKKILARINQLGFSELDSDKRFDDLLKIVQTSKVKPKKPSKPSEKRKWTADHGQMTVMITNSINDFSIALKADDGIEFGKFIESRLDGLFRQYQETKRGN